LFPGIFHAPMHDDIIACLKTFGAKEQPASAEFAAI
jgi:hypothetical protein